MKLDNSVKKKVIWNTNTIGGMFHVILGWKIELSLGWCYNYFLGSMHSGKRYKTRVNSKDSVIFHLPSKIIFLFHFPICHFRIGLEKESVELSDSEFDS